MQASMRNILNEYVSFQIRDQSNIAVDKILELQRRVEQSERNHNESQREIMRLEHEILAKVYAGCLLCPQ